MTRRGKIVCTLGPATGTDQSVRALVEAGMDVARMNFSHGEYSDHKAAYDRVRAASNATGRSIPGTGLGLAIVRMIVVNHGGDIDLTSTEGAGTTVTVWLPLLPQAQP